MTPVPGSLVRTSSTRRAASVGAVGHHHHAGVDGAADADPAAVVDAHPGGARGGVEQGVQDRPVGDGVGAVGHGLGLPVGAGHRPGVQVVAADHDRGRDLAGGHQLVEGQPGLVALAVAEPADPRRQPLEPDPLGGQLQPPAQVLVVAEQLQHGPVGAGDVGRVARQGGPAERPLALAEQRPDVGGHEPGVGEGVPEPGRAGLAAQVVAVVEHLGPGPLEADHGLAVAGHRLLGLLDVAGRVGVASRPGRRRGRPRWARTRRGGRGPRSGR